MNIPLRASNWPWHSQRFALWTLYRSRVVPALLLVSLLSILFAGALLAEDAVGLLDPKAFNIIVFRNLLVASVLMMAHGIYLALMSYHLVYKSPIEREQWIGVAFVFIFFAYFAHARHAYLHATGQHGWLGASWWSMAAFALTYVTMVAHGLWERKVETRDPTHSENRRPSSRTRRDWMLKTDIFMSALTLFLFGIALGVLKSFPSVEAFIAGTLHKVSGTLASVPIVQTLFEHGSAKDVAIVVALFAYAFARRNAKRQLKREQRLRCQDLLKHTHIDDGTTKWDQIRAALYSPLAKAGRTWLDIGCGTGIQFRELFSHLHQDATLPLPTEIIFLDENPDAIADVRREARAWVPPEVTVEIAGPTDMRSKWGRDVLARSNVIHLSHVAYTPKISRAVFSALRHAKPGTLLLIRFTSEASVYRTISASTSCAPWRPYIHHRIHPALLEDLKPSWTTLSTHLITRFYDIGDPKALEHITDWCDSQYGEFSGDVIERYLKGFAAAKQTKILNSDRLVILEKSV